MGTRWEKLTGDTSRFAVRLAFADDPDDGEGIDVETGFSWGSYQIWVEGRNLCAHFEEGERIDSVHWYLLPLLEWFAGNWNPLLHEERLPNRNDASSAWVALRQTMFPPSSIESDGPRAYRWERVWQDWWNRHALRASSEGGLYPDAVFRRHRDSVEVSWGRVCSAGMPEEFEFAESGPGVVRLSPQDVADPLHDILSAACEYLQTLDVESERLHVLDRTLRALTRSNQRQRRLMWLAGLGVDEQTVRAGWKRAKKWLSQVSGSDVALLHDTRRTPLVLAGSCHATLMFGCVAPDITKSDAIGLADLVVGLHSNDAADTLDSMRRFLPVDESDTPPWSQGYRLAEELHDDIDGDFTGGAMVNVDRLLGELGVVVEELALTDTAIRGVAIAGPQHTPCIAWNPNNHYNVGPRGRRFTLAHELCHLLHDWEVGRALAIASGPWAPFGVERRANSFAAMLLMPTRIVEEAVVNVDDSIETLDGVAAVASHLGTGFRATLSHLRNLGYIDDYVRESLLEAIGPPVASSFAGTGSDQDDHSVGGPRKQ